MTFLSSILVLLATARLLGGILERFGHPAVLGEMLAGLLWGPALLGLIHPNEALLAISEFAVFLAVLSSGLDMEFKEVVELFKGRGLITGILGFFVPLFSGIAVGSFFGLDAMRSLFLGLCIAITALPVAIRVLESFKVMDTDMAKYSVATAVLNDLAVLFALGVIMDLPEEKHMSSILKSLAMVGGKLLCLTLVILAFEKFANKMSSQSGKSGLKRVPEYIVSKFGNEALFGFVVVFVLAFSSLSEALGFHFVIGAFFGALLIRREFFTAQRYKEMEKALNSVSSGFLTPIFFATMGLEFGPDSLSKPGLLFAVLVVSVLSKVLSGWLGGKLAGLSTYESLGIGVILNGRGVMVMVVTNIAFQRGFIGTSLFSILVLMGVVTTVMTPILFKKLIKPNLELSSVASKVTS